jgi:hypothetical protein
VVPRAADRLAGHLADLFAHASSRASRSSSVKAAVEMGAAMSTVMAPGDEQASAPHDLRVPRRCGDDVGARRDGQVKTALLERPETAVRKRSALREQHLRVAA